MNRKLSRFINGTAIVLEAVKSKLGTAGEGECLATDAARRASSIELADGGSLPALHHHQLFAFNSSRSYAAGATVLGFT